MKAKIIARQWDDELTAAFGEPGSVVELPDTAEQLFRTLGAHGRFELHPPGPGRRGDSHVSDDGGDTWLVLYSNDYD